LPCPILAGLAALALPALAWDDHTPATRLAFADVPQVADAAPVPAEPLEAFLAAEEARIAEVLAAEEAWAREALPAWRARPEALAFAATGDAGDVVPRFLAAIRVNPDVRLPLYVALPAGAPPPAVPLPPEAITTLSDPGSLAEVAFAALEPGAPVLPLDVLATAATEPDCGLDIGLFEDNGTPAGLRYGLGVQPFGNPKLDYGSQAPFHMGFFHEAWIVYRLAPFLGASWPDARIHLYDTLAREAFASGHPYWGWRFTGWGLHHVQDLTQPYHARVLPGVSVIRMLWINTLAVIGFPRAKEDAVQLVSNRHLALEGFVHEALSREIREGAGPLSAALGPGRQEPTRPFREVSVRGDLTRESSGRAGEADRVVEGTLPAHLVADPAYAFGDSPEDDHLLDRLAADPGATERLTTLAGTLMASFGSWSRRFVASVREAGARGRADGGP